MTHNVGLGLLGGLVWAGYADKAKSSPLTLRPPAALDEEDFYVRALSVVCVQKPV